MLLAGCDGTNSRVRRALYPDSYKAYRLPVQAFGIKIEYSKEKIQPIQSLDPFFLQGTSSENNAFVYISGACPKTTRIAVIASMIIKTNI